MVLEKLGSSLYNSLKKVLRVSMVDKEVVSELIKNIQRSLLQADVNVKLVLELSKGIEERALKEKIPPGISRREHILKVVYEEIVKLLGTESLPLKVSPGRRNILMLIGIQGSGKTTTAVKLARYYQKRGFQTALICADTFRPGAYEQLKQLAEKVNIPIYDEKKGKKPLEIIHQGLKNFNKYELIIIDTSGRHKNEKNLIEEMKSFKKIIKPDEVIMVIDGTIGQQAVIQAKAFNDAAPIGSIIVAKLDGSARGGGALSAVSAIGAPIKFIGIGEKIEDLEIFNPPRFVGRLLGMGDLQSLVEKVKESEVKVPKKKAKAILSGKFSLADMYEQFEAMKNMGPFNKILKMIPGLGYEIPEQMVDVAEENLQKWRVIIQSMTPEEREDPKKLNSSRIRRIGRGSGTSEKEVKNLIRQYNKVRKMMKSLRRKRLPLFGKGRKISF